MSTPSPSPQTVTPSPIDRYQREATLGRGAWGVVYRARDSVIGRTVAMKVIQFDESLSEPDRHELAARSEREARAAGRLNHPNIVTIHDAGRLPADASFYIVMEYVDGMTLKDRLGQGPLPEGEAASILTQVASALDYAHREGVVHRDVKPANILLRHDGVAKLADFGIARVDSSDLTRTGQSMGSPAYMSPEQAMGRPVDARSDIFSLGVVLYEILAGRRPFESESMAALCLQIVNESPAPPSKVNPGISPRWDAVVRRAIEKRPEDRYPSASALIEEIDRVMRGEPTSEAVLAPARAPAPPAEATRTLAREPEPVASTLVLEEGPAVAKGPPPPRSRFSWRTIAGGAAIALVALLAFGALRGLMGRILPHGTVQIDVAHGLKSGTIAVAVDGRILWRQFVSGGAEEGVKGFFRKVAGRPSGRASGEVRVRPGGHTFTVTAESPADGGRWVESTTRTIRTGETQTLEIKVRVGLTKEMELDWS